jgi:hypothetical protein
MEQALKPEAQGNVAVVEAVMGPGTWRICTTSNLAVGEKLVPASSIASLSERLAEVNKRLVIAEAQLADMEFLSIEGFLDWRRERRAFRDARAALGKEDVSD